MQHVDQIYIHSYEFKFKPFAYKLNWEGRLEISSRYRIGSKILVGKASLPNQVIDFIDIVPDNSSRCYIKNRKCDVFRFNTFIQLSGDQYFAREFNKPEDIPIQLNFDFDSNNLNSFKSYNSYFNYSNVYNNKNIALSQYIASIKLLKIDTKFTYKNSFLIDRRWDKLSIPTLWVVKDGIQSYSYEYIYIKLNDYRDISGYYIRDLFAIKGRAQVHLDQQKVELSDGNTIHIPKEDIRSRDCQSWSYYSLEGNIRKTGDTYQYKNDYSNRGIFFQEKIEGYIWIRLKLLVSNHGYVLTIRNNFSFVDNKWKVKIISIDIDNYFQDLKKFKFINL